MMIILVLWIHSLQTLQSGGSVLSGIKWSSDSLSVCNQNAESLKKERMNTIDWPNDRRNYRNLTVTVVVSVI